MAEGKLKERLSEMSEENDSRLIHALDLVDDDLEKRDLTDKYLEIAKSVADSVVAVKAGYPLVLKNGLEIISKIKEEVNIPVIADFKIADVPHICNQIARCAFDAGADGAIAHGFVGKDSLEGVVKAASEGDGGVIVVPSMSHEGGKMFIQKFTDRMIELAQEVGATGVIGPATRPKDVKSLRAKIGDEMLLLTPGIGAQGGRPGDAVKNGADYEIVGRAIYTADSPRKAADSIRIEINEVAED